MVLVDTSIWIRFLSNTKPFATELDRLLERDEVCGHELVFGELLVGEVGGGRSKLLAAYERIQYAPPVPHSDVVAFVRARGLQGIGLGWLDAHLLASALTSRSALWTADSRLAAAARAVRAEHVLGFS
jgi:predicted nucleic acid-binding protein